MFAYEGGRGIKNSKNHAYVIYGRSLTKIITNEMNHNDQINVLNFASAKDINTLMVLTRELNKKVPKENNLLGSFGFENINFGIDGLENMGLPQSGDIVKSANGIPHIQTTFGKYLKYLFRVYNLMFILWFKGFPMISTGFLEMF